MPEGEFIPTGRGEELNRFAQEKWQEQLLLFSQVKNKVLEVNPHLRTPLNLEKGKPSPLGLFAEAALQEPPTGDSPEGKRKVEVWPVEHKRSAVLGRAVFENDQGQRYRDLDIKGTGAVEGYPSRVRPPWTATLGDPPSVTVWGLFDRKVAEYDYRLSEQFAQAGIRTSRTVAIIGLDELVVDGEKISRKEAVGRGIIEKSFRPVVEVRAFGTKARIADLLAPGNTMEFRRLLLEDAKQLVREELGLDHPLSDDEYLVWFAKTLGGNVALMHKNGWSHGYLGSGHNITLDCRIVDLDSVGELVREGERGLDILAAMSQFDRLADLGGASFNETVRGNYRTSFEKSYAEVFPPEERARMFQVAGSDQFGKIR